MGGGCNVSKRRWQEVVRTAPQHHTSPHLPAPPRLPPPPHTQTHVLKPYFASASVFCLLGARRKLRTQRGTDLPRIPSARSKSREKPHLLGPPQHSFICSFVSGFGFFFFFFFFFLLSYCMLKVQAFRVICAYTSFYLDRFPFYLQKCQHRSAHCSF